MKKSKMRSLSAATYKVGDIDQAKEWYSKIFEIEPYYDRPFYVGFSIGGYELGLHPGDNSSTEKSGGVIAYWEVDEMQKVYNRLVKAGAADHKEPLYVEGKIFSVEVKDPWGNVIGLVLARN